MKFLLADDHALFREGMKHILIKMEPDAEIVEASTSGEAITIALKNPDINLILLDLHMPDSNGMNALKEISSKLSTAVVVILTASERVSDMKMAMQEGAVGYIAKSMAPEIMIKALQLVLSGGIYVPPELISKSSSTVLPGHRVNRLSLRHKEIVQLLADGQSNKQIAYLLGVTEATVKTHVSAILKVLNVNNRTQAAMVAKKLKLV